MGESSEEQNIAVFYWGIFLILLLFGGLIYSVVYIYISLFFLSTGLIILVISVMSLIQNYTDIEFKIIIILLGRKRLKFWQHRLVEKRYALLSNKILETKKFHLIKRLDQFALIPIIKYLEQNSFLLSQMTAYGQKLVHNCVRKNFHHTTLDAFYGYFEYSTKELIGQLVRDETISPSLQARIINEAGFEDRLLIEQLLPNSEEILREIHSRHKIALTNGFELFI